jgi:hypothetical protein
MPVDLATCQRQPVLCQHFSLYKKLILMEEAPSIAFESPEEAALVENLVANFPEACTENARMVKFMAECCLRNRGYDFASAQKRLGKYLAWRKETFGHLEDQTVENNEVLRSQIHAALMYVCPTRMPNGAALLFVRMRHHNPTQFDAHMTLQYWHYMMLTLLAKDPTLAATGFVIVNNFEGATLANTDINVPRAISSALNKSMPVRVNSINLVNPPWILRMIIPVFKSVLSAKLGERLNVVLQHEDLPAVLSIPQAVLPTELGGEVDVDAPNGYLDELIGQNLSV